MQIDLDNLKCLSPGLHCLLQLLLDSPSQGPGVHVPPPTTITAVQYLLQKAPEKSADSRRMATCDGLADWNQRKVTQYGGQQNHIQDLALIDDCRLTLIHPG